MYFGGGKGAEHFPKQQDNVVSESTSHRKTSVLFFCPPLRNEKNNVITIVSTASLSESSMFDTHKKMNRVILMSGISFYIS